jgi:hypothetical protein
LRCDVVRSVMMCSHVHHAGQYSTSATVESAERDRPAERVLKTKLLSEAVSVAMGVKVNDDDGDDVNDD